MKNLTNIDATSNSLNTITICVENRVQNWPTNDSTETHLKTMDYPTIEDSFEILSQVLYRRHYKDGIEELKNKLKVEILYEESDKGELFVLKEELGVDFTIETHYREGAVYYISITSDDSDIIEEFRDILDYEGNFVKEGRILTEKEKDYLERFYHQIIAVNQLLYVHYIPEGTDLKVHCERMKNKYVGK